MSEIILPAKIIIAVGLLFDLFGAIGLVRLPDVYNRVQAATKCVTLGTCFILVGVFVHAVAAGIPALGVKGLLCALFVILTSPVGAHAIARGAHIAGVRLWEGSVADKYQEKRLVGGASAPRENP
jgi:multicomponent Na+:H+ antiporter subunit G